MAKHEVLPDMLRSKDPVQSIADALEEVINKKVHPGPKDYMKKPEYPGIYVYSGGIDTNGMEITGEKVHIEIYCDVKSSYEESRELRDKVLKALKDKTKVYELLEARDHVVYHGEFMESGKRKDDSKSFNTDLTVMVKV